MASQHFQSQFFCDEEYLFSSRSLCSCTLVCHSPVKGMRCLVPQCLSHILFITYPVTEPPYFLKVQAILTTLFSINFL